MICKYPRKLKSINYTWTVFVHHVPIIHIHVGVYFAYTYTPRQKCLINYKPCLVGVAAQIFIPSSIAGGTFLYLASIRMCSLIFLV